MAAQRKNITLSDQLTVRTELRRRKLLAFLRSDRPAWHEHDHPELVAGTAAWVRKLRSEGETCLRD